MLLITLRGVKWKGREADHLPQSGAEVRNGGAISLLPQTCSWFGA
jgi:hypothetical protein